MGPAGAYAEQSRVDPCEGCGGRVCGVHATLTRRTETVMRAPILRRLSGIAFKLVARVSWVR